MRRTFVFLCLLSAVGCGNPVATVTGKVTLDGKALEFGDIGFHLENGTSVGNTKIMNGGAYSIGANAQLPPGSYKVVIIANETSVSKGPGSVVMPKRITPEKYGTKESTPLKVELKAGANTANFDLK
jgi:hypothetical protein